MLIFKFISLFRATPRITLHALMLKKNKKKKTQFFHSVGYCSTVFPLCLKLSVLAPVSLRPPS